MKFPARRRPAAFTLIEMLVVIGVIVILVGLTVAVIPIVTDQSAKRETESVLTVLDQAVQAWEVQADRRVTVGQGSSYDIDIDVNDTDAKRLSHFLTIIRRNDEAAGILANVSATLLTLEQRDPPEEDLYKLLDAWGQPVVVLFPGNEWQVGNPLDRKDEDGTFRTFGDPAAGTHGEEELGIARGRRTAFVSAGSDGRLGDLHLEKALNQLTPDEQSEAAQAEDNVTSYELLRTRPQP